MTILRTLFALTVLVLLTSTAYAGKHWKIETLHTFCSKANCADGNAPLAGVVQDAQGNLFGTTEIGGAYNEGVVYELQKKTTRLVVPSHSRFLPKVRLPGRLCACSRSYRGRQRKHLWRDSRRRHGNPWMRCRVRTLGTELEVQDAAFVLRQRWRRRRAERGSQLLWKSGRGFLRRCVATLWRDG